MITLPYECFLNIFDNLRTHYKSLFSCLLVNRQWCRIIIPILWSEPLAHIADRRLIKMYLLELNTREKALLDPFNLSLSNGPKPLFEYAAYTTFIGYYLNKGIADLFKYVVYDSAFRYRNASLAVKCSLISMFLRSSKKLKYLSIHGFINDNIINLLQETLCQSTTIISLELYNNHIDFGAKKALCTNNKLSSLIIYDNQFCPGEKVLAEILCMNTTLTFLSLKNNGLGPEDGKILAGALCENTTLTFLNLSRNNLGFEGGNALAKALCKNSSLTSLILHGNQLGSWGGKALAEALYQNTTLTHLDLCNNQIGTEGGKALAEALYKNTTLSVLDICDNQIGYEGGLALVKALCKNTTLTSLNLGYNRLCRHCRSIISDSEMAYNRLIIT